MIQLEKQELAQRIELRGTGRGYGSLARDGYIQFGLMMPGFTKANILTFDMGRVISPETDTIRVIGRSFRVPSNIALPEQTESYFFDVTLDKPVYRTFFANTKPQARLFGLHGRFNLKTVADKMRGGSEFVDIVNDIEFISGGYRDFALENRNPGRKNMSINQFRFNGPKKTVRAPRMGRDMVMIAIAFTEESGYLFPSDLKTALSRQSVRLKTTRGANKILMRAIQPKDTLVGRSNRPDRPLTATIEPLNKSSKGNNFLNFIDQPEISGDRIRLESPRGAKSANPLATLITLSM